MQKKPIYRIMIADDDFDDLEFVAFLFESHSQFELVDSITCGSDIINHINAMTNPPDVLLTDHLMPIISGADAVRHILKNKSAPKMEIFLFSSVEQPALEKEFKNRENVTFIKKPKTLTEYNDLPNVIIDKLNYSSQF